MSPQAASVSCSVKCWRRPCRTPLWCSVIDIWILECKFQKLFHPELGLRLLHSVISPCPKDDGDYLGLGPKLAWMHGSWLVEGEVSRDVGGAWRNKGWERLLVPKLQTPLRAAKLKPRGRGRNVKVVKIKMEWLGSTLTKINNTKQGSSENRVHINDCVIVTITENCQIQLIERPP